MNLQDFLNSRAAVALSLGLSSAIPPWMGYPVSRWLADRISSRKKTDPVRAVRANQWVIHHQKVKGQELDTLVRNVFRSSGRSLYDFYHYLKRPEVVKEMVEFEPSFRECFERARQETNATFFVAPHISNFDLIGRAMVLHGLPLHILSYPQPPGGYRRQNELRLLPGLKVTPMSVEALQQASKTLRSNGALITGVDRPLPVEEAKYTPSFFGMPAAMPVFHIRLALKHKIPLTVLGARRRSDGSYTVWASDPIEMKPHPDLIEETVRNAENVLTVIAKFICQAPDQWAMYYPVWPETLPSIPE
jgi:phosphatidylinositol dimannoside acyltransferase